MESSALTIFRKLKRCSRGVTAIEFALIAPVLLLMIMGTVEVSLLMYAKAVMESASFQGSRTGKTGYIASGQTQQQTILATINQRAGIFLDTSKVAITSKSYSSFGNIEDPEPFVDADGDGTRDSNENYTDVNGNGQYDNDMGTSGYGNASQITVYTLTYPWQIQTPIVNQFFPSTITISARSVVKNEPY